MDHRISLRSQGGHGRSLQGLLSPQKTASRALGANMGLALPSLLTRVMFAWYVTVRMVLWSLLDTWQCVWHSEARSGSWATAPAFTGILSRAKGRSGLSSVSHFHTEDGSPFLIRYIPITFSRHIMGLCPPCGAQGKIPEPGGSSAVLALAGLSVVEEHLISVNMPWATGVEQTLWSLRGTVGRRKVNQRKGGKRTKLPSSKGPWF